MHDKERMSDGLLVGSSINMRCFIGPIDTSNISIILTYRIHQRSHLQNSKSCWVQKNLSRDTRNNKLRFCCFEIHLTEVFIFLILQIRFDFYRYDLTENVCFIIWQNWLHFYKFDLTESVNVMILEIKFEFYHSDLTENFSFVVLQI